MLTVFIIIKYSEINLHESDSPELAIQDNSTRNVCGVI